MFKCLVFSACLAFSFVSVADDWGSAMANSVDCRGYHAFELPECQDHFSDGPAIAPAVEVAPEQVDFSQGRVESQLKEKRLKAGLSVTVEGKVKPIVVFDDELAASIDSSAVKDQLKRLQAEAEAELERYKTEGKKVIVLTDRVKIAPPVILDEASLRLDGNQFAEQFFSGASDDGKVAEKQRRHNFGNPRLSDAEAEALNAEMDRIIERHQAAGRDLRPLLNCVDDAAVCHQAYTDKFIADNRDGKYQTFELKRLLSALHGSDIIAPGSQAAPRAANVVEEGGEVEGVEKGELNPPHSNATQQ